MIDRAALLVNAVNRVSSDEDAAWLPQRDVLTISSVVLKVQVQAAGDV